MSKCVRTRLTLSESSEPLGHVRCRPLRGVRCLPLQSEFPPFSAKRPLRRAREREARCRREGHASRGPSSHPQKGGTNMQKRERTMRSARPVDMCACAHRQYSSLRVCCSVLPPDSMRRATCCARTVRTSTIEAADVLGLVVMLKCLVLSQRVEGDACRRVGRQSELREELAELGLREPRLWA